MSAKAATTLHRVKQTSSKSKLVFVALAAAAVLAACGGGAGVRQSDVEADIRAKLGDKTGASIESVTCPQEIPSKPGDGFSCTAFVKAGSVIEVPVTITTGGGFEWDYAGRSRDVAAISEKVAGLMRTELDDPGIKLACPESVVVADGDSFECKATDTEGSEAEVIVTVDGDEVTWEMVAE